MSPRSDEELESRKRPSPSPPRQRSKKKKIAVFEESGITDAERRQLRHDQRQIHDTIVDDQRAGEAPMEFLEDTRNQNNELFEKVAYTREAVLDAENIDLIAQKYVQQVDRMIQVSKL